jgi:peptidoglycan/LPS O-acetylase OafA/YrhL
VHPPVLHFSILWMQRTLQLRFTVGNLADTAIVLGIVGAAIALASQTYRFIEKPFLLKKAKLAA